MTILLTTFERDFRTRLLDVVYGQWHDLGVPLSSALYPQSTEVIDPEALLWCSFEFLPTEPRLRESLLGWLQANEHYIIRQRLNKVARNGEPRTNIWRALDSKTIREVDRPNEVCHGLDEVEELLTFCERLSAEVQDGRWPKARLVQAAPRSSTLLLQARDLLGNDIRHLLLVYLLANPAGGKLKAIQSWSGYSYRSISETATRWEATGVLSIDHGYCRLIHLEPWKALLRLSAEQTVIVDWFFLFDACIRLLRAVGKAERKGLSWDSGVVTSFRGEAAQALVSSVRSETRAEPPSIAHLRELLTGAATRQH